MEPQARTPGLHPSQHQQRHPPEHAGRILCGGERAGRAKHHRALILKWLTPDSLPATRFDFESGLFQSVSHPISGPRNKLAPGLLWERGKAAIGQCLPWEVRVEQFIHRQNLDHYRRLLAAQDQKDDVRRQTILKLLADEMSKIPLPRIGT